eukprot:g21061.t1
MHSPSSCTDSLSDPRIRHKTNSRRHPKWQEIQYWIKRWHRFYLRRRAVKRAEERGTEAQLKKALASS